MNEQEKRQQPPEPEKQFTMGKRVGLPASFRNSPLVKIIMIWLLMLLLQVPISMINSTVGGRQTRSQEAVQEVVAKWGREQHLLGPFIIVPYEREIVQCTTDDKEKTKKITVLEYANFLPEDLRVTAKADNSIRNRGIFEVPVYRLDLTMAGRFEQPDFTTLRVAPSRILWEQASLAVIVSDPKAITNHATLNWNGEEIAFQPGGQEFLGTSRGIIVPLRKKITAEAGTFSFHLDLQGSQGVFFAPMGRDTSVAIESNWPDPSFQGNWLPVKQQIGKDGFTASWQVASLGRNFSQSWIDKPNTEKQFTFDQFGVNFIQPVDTYRMTERSIKYQFLFLGLTFLPLWLFEVLAGVRLHPLQYLLVGAGMCLFYLLELSLAEHLGFFTAYLIAASAIVALEGFYCLAILKSTRRAAVIGGFVALLYCYLSTRLLHQDYALLAGSVGLFLLLAGIMYLTREIDWFAIGDFKGDGRAEGLLAIEEGGGAK